MPKLKTIIWFLRRPKYYRQVIQILKRNKHKGKENTRVQATEWCRENCISQQQALEKLTNNNTLPSLNQLFPEIVQNAQNCAKRSPIKMGGEGAISLIYQIVKYFEPKNCLETGVAYGWSSLAILLALQNIKDARLISNDMPYVNKNNEDFVGIVIPDSLKGKWNLQRLPDISGIPLAIKEFNGTLEFVHYDSDKSYTGRTWATPILWQALKNGSIMMIDDINDNIAFKEFCQLIKMDPIIVEHEEKYVGILKKG